MRLLGAGRKASRVARFRPFLIRLLAAVLLLQSGVAVAHCLRGMAAGEGMLVEICSAEGMRSVMLDAQGEPISSPDGEMAGFCPICHGLPVVMLPEPPGAFTPAWLDVTAIWLGLGTDAPPRAARAPPYTTRAPPVTA